MKAQITTPVARLSEFEEGHAVHGVAIGEDDRTDGLHSLKRWPRDVLEPAADSLAGTPVTDQHGGDPVGRITRSAYEPGVGVVYEATLSDEDVANQLSLGQRDVSIEGGNPERVEHDDEGAAILHGFQFDGMAIVENGASPSNHSSAGSAADNQAIAALSGGDIAAKLASYSVEYSGTAGGELDASELPSDGFESHYLIDGSTKSDSSFPVVDASDDLRRGNVSSAWDLRGHAPDESAMRSALLDLNDAFDSPPIETDDEAEASAGDEAPEAEEPSQTDETDSNNGSNTTMTDEDTGEQYEELAAKLSERDDRVEELQEQVEELDDENAELASRVEELEEAEEEIASVKEVYAAELANGSFTEDDLVEKFTVAELREKFEADDDADLVESEPDVQTGGGDDDDVSAALSADEKEEKDLLETRVETFEDRGWDAAAQTNREKLAELTGDKSILEGDA